MMSLTEQRSRPRGPLLAAAAGLLALVAGVAILLGGNHTTKHSPSKSARKTATGPATGTGKDATLTADNVTFVDLGAKVPTGAAGPNVTKDGRALGFDRSPAGAVLAAVNISGRSASDFGPGVFEPTINEQVVGPDKDKLLARTQQSYRDQSAKGVGPHGEVTAAFEQARADRVGVWAYRIDSYDDSAASLNVVMRQFAAGSTSPAYVNFAFNVRWLDGDWRLVAPLDGDFSSLAKQLLDIPSSYVVIGKD